MMHWAVRHHSLVAAVAVAIVELASVGSVGLSAAEPAVYFSPTQDRAIEQAVCGAISGAKREIRVAMYSFTRRPIRQELMKAKSRGVDVAVILDRAQAGGAYSEWRDLKSAGVGVFFYAPEARLKRGVMHHKYAVIDRHLTLTGSFNWTGNGVAYNQENLLVLESDDVAARFLENWNSIPRDSLAPPARTVAYHSMYDGPPVTDVVKNPPVVQWTVLCSPAGYKIQESLSIYKQHITSPVPSKGWRYVCCTTDPSSLEALKKRFEIKLPIERVEPLLDTPGVAEDAAEILEAYGRGMTR